MNGSGETGFVVKPTGGTAFFGCGEEVLWGDLLGRIGETEVGLGEGVKDSFLRVNRGGCSCRRCCC